jgi:hypothetical protein
MKKTVLILITLVSASISSVLAQKPAVVTTKKPGWHKIGEVTASFKNDNESIIVLGADEFTAVKLKVTDAPIHIQRAQVFYESGDMEEIEVSTDLQKGAETSAFNLKYPGKDINKVSFAYRTIANSKGEKAHLELLGLKGDLPKQDDAYRNDKGETRSETIGRKSEQWGNDVSEAAAKTMATITDQRHASKVGPHDETIFIDNYGKFYYINNEGNKVFVSNEQLKDKKK